MSNGRSISEFVIVNTAMQTSDANAIATEGWQPGEKVIVPPPQTAQDADARAGEGYDYTDWYSRKNNYEKIASVNAIQTLDDTEVQALKDTLDDEYKSRKLRQVIRDFGEVRPFINIVEAEARDASALLNLFERYGASPPANRWSGRAPGISAFMKPASPAFRAKSRMWRFTTGF